MELRVKVPEQTVITHVKDEDLLALEPEEVEPYLQALAQDLFRHKVFYIIEGELPEGLTNSEE